MASSNEDAVYFTLMCEYYSVLQHHIIGKVSPGFTKSVRWMIEVGMHFTGLQ
jgi:hypothetical protein